MFASFVAAVLGLGGDFNISFEKEDASVLKFERLETLYINIEAGTSLGNKYLVDSINAEAVKAFFAHKENSRKSLFIIIGVKIARGAVCSYKKVRETSANSKIAVDGTSASLPISTSPQLAFSKQYIDKESFGSSLDFVFAYSL